MQPQTASRCLSHSVRASLSPLSPPLILLLILVPRSHATESIFIGYTTPAAAAAATTTVAVAECIEPVGVS